MQSFSAPLTWDRRIPLRVHAGPDLLGEPKVSIEPLLPPDRCPKPDSAVPPAAPGRLAACFDLTAEPWHLAPDRNGRYAWPDGATDGNYYTLVCATFRRLDTLEVSECFEFSVALVSPKR